MSLCKLLFSVCSIVVALSLVCAAQQVTISKVPMKCVSRSSGEEMYTHYCAACHGLTGKGNGPAASALKSTPTDLTRLAEQNGGKFPDTHVYTVIRGDANMPAAHGDKDMPLWEGVFRGSCGTRTESDVHMRIHNLTKYVEKLQKG